MEKITSENESNDELQPIKVKEEKNDLKTDNEIVNINFKSECEKKCETLVENKVAVKNELDDVKVYDEISLSEGELSKEFESFSSVNSAGEIDDLDLSSLDDDDDGCGCNNDNINVVIQIENELAFKSDKDGNGRTHWKDEKSIPVRHFNKTEKCLGDYTNKRYNGFQDYKDHKHWRNNIENYKYSRRDKRSGEREVFNRKRSPTPRDYDRHRNTHNDRSKNGRRIDANIRSRRSKSSERTTRYRTSRSLEKNRLVPRSPNYKDRKIERKHFNSFDVKARKRNDRSPTMYNKRKRSPLSNSPASVWKRLDSRISPDRLSNRTRKPYNKSARKKERTPFLIELERKLKEADILTYTKIDTTKAATVQKEVPIKINDIETVVAPEPMPPVNQNPNPRYPTTYLPPVQNAVHPLQYPPIPTLSVDNLPLVPGPNGLPVYITMTGEHILHDMDGRRIPVGPNGYYLPLDPTGRLYAHIVSPGNQAVPIHMTDDGVLRLPNSEPVPFGPGHKLPVNVDGNYILIGPDSKPLYPCLNIPREPPLQLLQMVNTGMNYQHNALQPVIPQAPPLMVPQPLLPPMISQPPQTMMPQPPTTVVLQPPKPVISEPPQPENQQTVQTKPKCISIPDESNRSNIFHPGKINPPLIDVIEKSNDKKPKTGALITDNEKVRQKNVGASIVQVANETENNAVVNTKSQDIGRRWTPKKFSPVTKDDTCGSISDMVLDLCDSENSTCSVRVSPNPKKGSFEEIQLSSDDEASCDKESSKAERKNVERDSIDAVAKKIGQAIKSLSESNYKPPAFGRFILSKVPKQVVEKLPNESPLVRNRVKLFFLTPSAPWPTNQPVIQDITFKFLSKKNLPKGEIPASDYDKSQEKISNVSEISTSTVDFAVQCDLTSDEITKLRFNVAKLESEVIRLKNTNMSLLEGYRSAQVMIDRKNEELKKVFQEVIEKKK